MASLFIDRIKLNPDEGVQHHDSLVQRIYTPCSPPPFTTGAAAGA